MIGTILTTLDFTILMIISCCGKFMSCDDATNSSFIEITRGLTHFSIDRFNDDRHKPSI